MIHRLGAALARLLRAVMPDPFVLAVLLTAVTALLALALRPVGPLDVVRAWGGGLWGLLAFAMQMVLVLVTGHALASAPVVRRQLDRIADVPRTPRGAIALVAVVAMLAGLLNWGLGLILGALLARAVGRRCAERGVRVHHPLLVSAGYMGMAVWHGGFSGSAPLKVTTAKDLAELLGPDLAARVAPIPPQETLLAPMNLVVTGGLLVLVPLTLVLLSPPPGDPSIETADRFVAAPAADSPAPTAAGPRGDDASAARASRFAERLEGSPVVTVLLVLFGGGALALHYGETGISRLDPNVVNLTLLVLGLLLHVRPASYLRAVGEAVGGASGIILQFPLYAGIMGIMKATGLAAQLAGWATALGGTKAFGAATFLSAGLINLFVPSGGGQWAVQGPIAIEASQALGAPPSYAVMAVAYGDQWTNLLQPFWALPLLAITGVRARDMMGYTAVVLIVSGAWILAGLWLFG